MEREDIKLYRKYMPMLADFMVKHGYTQKPLCKVILDDTKQDGLFIKTGYFDPDRNGIRLFINGRHPKDVLRTLAHELRHWNQQLNGEIEKSGYKGDKISEDENLIKLEKDAFLMGNIAFRMWTEEMQRKGEK